MPIDYRILLIKYINHVGNMEGVTFIDHRYRPEDITEEEWECLIALDKEAAEGL